LALTPAFARSVIDLEIDTDASHLVIVATGRIHREAGLLLSNHSRRRLSSGQDFKMIVADDVTTAGRELEGALERVSQRIIAEELCVLDNSIGISVSKLVLTKFQLLTPARTPETNQAVVATPEWEHSPVPLALAAVASGPMGMVVDVEPQSDPVAQYPKDPEPREDKGTFEVSGPNNSSTFE
jgi:hypothetical protein